MKIVRRQGFQSLPLKQDAPRRRNKSDLNAQNRGDGGFTLVELLIVVTILPMIIGGLSIGLLSVFSLQSGVANRLSDTADSQVASASFENDVQSAVEITTVSGTTAQCGTGTQLLGLEWNPDTSGSGNFDTVVSYVEVATSTGNSLIRQYCTAASPGTASASAFLTTPTSSSILSTDVPTALAIPTILPGAVATSASGGWTSTQSVTTVSFPIVEPKSTYPYTLVAVPQASASAGATGTPIATAATAGCNFASPGSGTYASTLCFVDFSSLTGNNYLAATSGCLEMTVNLPNNFNMYFCLGITGSTVAPATLPTYPQAFLGNSGSGNTANYTNVAGDPSLYQSQSGTTTVKISNIVVDNPEGVPATGWEAVGADAESTDANESMTWTSNTALNLLPNGQSYDTSSDPIGNACLDDQSVTGLTGLGTDQLSCEGTVTYTSGNQQVTENITSSAKTGAAMVWAATPTTFTTTMVGGGLEAMSFGLLLS